MLSRFPPVAVAGLLVAACSYFDPSVGPRMDPPDAGDPPSCGPAYPGGAPTGSAGQMAFCTDDGGPLPDDCDACEAASCCALRVACYGDPTCACADDALDACNGSSAGADAGASCWSAFAAANSVAEQRYECLRAACRDVCSIPQ
jgi:hypothetical protein